MGARDFLTDVKAAAAVAVTTAGTSVSQVLEWIPDDIGKLGTLVGIVLSTVLIYSHLRRTSVTCRKTNIEIEILEKYEAERKETAHRRIRLGKPVRRKDEDRL